MSQDEQETIKVDETTPPAPEELNTKEDNASEGDETPKAPASEAQPNEVDYKSELDKAKKQLGQAEYTIQELKKTKQDKPETVEVTPDDSGYVTAEQLTKSLEDKFSRELDSREQKMRYELVQDTVAETVSSLSDNTDEQELIRFHYENSIRPTGLSRQAILQDLRRAKLLANEKRLAVENEELKVALKAKNSVGNSAIGSNQDKQEPFEEPNLSPQERTILKHSADAAGLTLKEYLRRNKSRLTNE